MSDEPKRCCNCGKKMIDKEGYSNPLYKEYYCCMNCHTLQVRKRVIGEAV